MSELITLLVYLLIGGILVWGVQLVLGLLALPSQIKTLVLVIVSLIILAWILNALGIFVL